MKKAVDMKNLALVAVALFAASSKGATCTYTDGSWDVTPAEGDDIVIVSSNLTWDSSLPMKVGSWTQGAGYAGTVTFDTGLETFEVTGDVVLEGGVWTHAKNPTTLTKSTEGGISGRGTKQLIVSVGGNFTLTAPAKIDVTAMGYYGGQGPGSSANWPSGSGSASHGGSGAIQNAQFINQRSIAPGYGSAKCPDTLGSGGSSGAETRRGGGAVRLTVAGALTLDGDILAKGGTTTGTLPDWYPGSGGSVWLTAADLCGTGTVSVAGGNTQNGTGGAPGRVAFYVTGDGKDFSGYTGEVDFSSRVATYAAHTGTFYRETKADNGKGELWVKGYDAPTDKLPSFTLKWNRYGTYVCDTDAPVEFSTIRMTGHSTLLIPSNVTVTASNFISENDGAWTNRIVLMGGELKMTPDATVSNLEIIVFMPGSDIGFVSGDGAGTLRIADGGRVSPAIDMTLHGPLHIGKGGSYSHFQGYPVAITVPGDCTIEEGGAIDVCGKGYSKKSGPGKSTTASCGGSHGGRGNGGSSGGDSAPGGNGPCYGSVTSPVTMGSGGMSEEDCSGGGAIKLVVEGTLDVEGKITADSIDSYHYTGAGGSIWIIAKRLTGSGPITATGGIIGKNGQWNASGGGGRIAVYLTDESSGFDDFTGVITAHGGGKADGSVYGGPGTVYYKLANEAVDEGTLVIDNGPTAQYRNFECRFDEDVTDLVFGKVVISNKSTLAVAPGKSVVFSKAWENHGEFRAEEGSLVECRPDDTATIAGTNRFYGFTCAAPGKTLAFSTVSSLFAVQAAGTLALSGSQDSPLALKSLLPGTPWYMNIDAAAVQEITAVDVADSDASPGALVVALDSAGEGKGNENWRFTTIVPGAVITWTGAASDAFGDPGNWDLRRFPAETDNVVIKAGGEHLPALSAPVSLAGLTVESGASLALSGYDVSVSNLTVAGTLLADGRERLSVTGDADFKGGTFEPKSTVLALEGSAEQSLACGSVSLNDVFVDKDGGSLGVADCVTAERVRIKARAALAVSFAAGTTLTAREVRFDGLQGDNALLTLRSASPGAAWNVKAGEYAYASGVTVADSDASRGLMFRTQAPSSGSGCVNWDFSSALFTWTGAEDGEFTNANNWALGIAPDATSSVFIDGGAAITISSPAAVRDLVIGGGDEATSFTAAAPLAVSGMFVVASNGVFTGATNITVGGSMTVQRGGKIDHLANTTKEGYKLDLSVGGNLVIDEGGAIDVSGCGYGRKNGPGGSGLAECGPSHGGTGEGKTTARSYGSILHPRHSGTGGWWDSAASCGGGIVKLKVAGTLTVDGVILSDGIDEDLTKESYYAATGGSIDIECAALAGRGDISATAGRITYYRTGAGGRIAVRLTAADTYEDTFTGSVRCYGGKRYIVNSETLPRASSGTFYLQGMSSAEGAGTVLIDGGGRAAKDYPNSHVEYPVPLYADAPGALKNATFVLRKGGSMKLLRDCTIGELEIEDTSSRLYLNGFTLSVLSHRHKDDGWSNQSTVIVPGDGGKIVFKDKGLFIIVR